MLLISKSLQCWCDLRSKKKLPARRVHGLAGAELTANGGGSNTVVAMRNCWSRFALYAFVISVTPCPYFGLGRAYTSPFYTVLSHPIPPVRATLSCNGVRYRTTYPRAILHYTPHILICRCLAWSKYCLQCALGESK